MALRGKTIRWNFQNIAGLGRGHGEDNHIIVKLDTGMFLSIRLFGLGHLISPAEIFNVTKMYRTSYSLSSF
jgi:hypothetical protein